MDVKQAVSTAKSYVGELFASEDISELGLEEVSLDESSGQWLVTVGFARPWEKEAPVLSDLLRGTKPYPRRSYKIVRISDKTGSVVAVQNR
ncbi:MAG: hypothetical protein ABSD90_00665 [Methylocystis sp.]|jgi:hypothetical protein